MICNAGILEGSKLADMKTETYEKLLQVNLIAPFVLARESIPHLREVKGNIVIISSVTGLRGVETMGAYGSTKAALTLMAKTMAKEEAPNGIRVNVISPGPILSDMTKNLTQQPKYVSMVFQK